MAGEIMYDNYYFEIITCGIYTKYQYKSYIVEIAVITVIDNYCSGFDT